MKVKSLKGVTLLSDRIPEEGIEQSELWKEIFKSFSDEVLNDNLTFEQFLRLLQRNYEVKIKV